eukprot:1146465-Pelagomonas_calceolata.AAC.3
MPAKMGSPGSCPPARLISSDVWALHQGHCLGSLGDHCTTWGCDDCAGCNAAAPTCMSASAKFTKSAGHELIK